MHRLHLLGLNHTTAPLDLRERMAFNTGQRQAALQSFIERFPECEAVLLSTCNRVELYSARQVHGHPRSEEILQFLADFQSIDAALLKPHVYQRANREMVEHLFSVASSLDSMVLGETQILGQLREAYEAAGERRCARGLLNPLFQRAIAVGKQVMRETALAEGRLSIASVAVNYAGQIFDHFSDKTILCIGAGKMARLVLQHFAALSPGKLLICNRDGQKAVELAGQHNGTAVPFDRLDEHLVNVDIVVTSTGSSDPIITAGRFSAAHRRRRYRPMFIIDIALPRDVEPAVGELENVYLYNIDDLQQVVAQTQSGRQKAIESAQEIVRKAVEDFQRAHRARAMGPLIDQLYKRSHQLARDELARTVNKLPNMTAAEKSHLEDLARRIVNKMLHEPIEALRNSDAVHGSPEQYIHAVEQLFRLKVDQVQAGYQSPAGPPQQPEPGE